MHPFFLLMAMAGIGGGLYTISERDSGLLPLILGASAAAFVLRALQLRHAQRRERGGDIRFGALRGGDIQRYAGWLKENLRGHDQVVDQVVGRIQRGLNLAAPRRTLGSFMLVGPTGTGKTFLAELVARALYPDSEPLVLRMNQYKDAKDVFTLLGPPPGHHGSEVGGALTAPVLENPYRVIILDEIDKCHRDVQHCLYDILDTAECREKSSGRTVHFSACVVFATCNAGVEGLREASRDAGAFSGRARDALAQAGFEKAFLARFDEILLMDELKPVHIAEIACLQLVKYWKQYGIQVTYASPEVLMEAMRRNAELKEYGVRQLAHLIHRLTDSSIEQAKKSGAKSVRLDIDRATGRIVIA